MNPSQAQKFTAATRAAREDQGTRLSMALAGFTQEAIDQRLKTIRRDRIRATMTALTS